ncbi:MAG TPA: YopX family protein [Ignavibacteriales bacterium]|nr:YopX family protein [Ignavibacteriales bacterium]
MNREIKFKVFDKELKRMSEPFKLSDPVVVFPDEVLPIFFVLHDEERFIKLQFTGFEGGHGIGIYEGDILYLGQSNFVSASRAIVSWDEIEGKWIVRDEADQEVYDLCDYNFDEIIGNIHSNSELLKEGK